MYRRLLILFLELLTGVNPSLFSKDYFAEIHFIVIESGVGAGDVGCWVWSGGDRQTSYLHAVLPDGKILQIGGAESSGALPACRHVGVQAQEPVLCV